MPSYRDCHEVSAACPVQATTYGYYPNLAGNAALLGIFALLVLLQLVASAWRRVYAYSLVVAAGCVLEALGYAGRIMMHSNPWSDSGMKLQIICLIMAPSFVAAGIYLTLKHVVLHNGPEYSRIRPALYTWIFIGCDIGSICLQAIGGGLAASANGANKALLDAGNAVIIAGIAFQVVTMIAAGLVAAEYLYKRRAARRADGGAAQRHEAEIYSKSEQTKARIFQAAVAFAYLTVLIRCIYRLPEMAGGWGNPRMRNEKEFLILDGMMIALASIALTLFHPGFLYPSMRTGHPASKVEPQSSSGEEEKP